VSDRRPPTDADLDALAELAAGLSDRGWRHQETRGLDFFALRDPTGEEVLHLYARRDAGAKVLEALDAARVALPRLVTEVRRLRAAVEEARSQPAPRPVAAPAPVPARGPARVLEMPVDDDTPLAMSAPFRVGPKESKAAQTDPLAALAVQVAKALSADAKELERARLIAMALAASRGDLDAFWSARKMRATGKAPQAGKAPARKK
jgi:hypothetical protein